MSCGFVSGSVCSTFPVVAGRWEWERDRLKAAITIGSGLDKFFVVPFSLCNAPATFYQLVSGHSWEVCLLYLDDVSACANSKLNLSGCRQCFSDSDNNNSKNSNKWIY